jgi:hypothetical protein
MEIDRFGNASAMADFRPISRCVEKQFVRVARLILGQLVQGSLERAEDVGGSFAK